MNRPSRTDDDLEHPTWNQNPPFLAPDLTTCEDLNGIANSRVLKNSPGGSAASLSLLSEGSPFFGQNEPECDKVMYLRVEMVPIQERLHHLFSRLSHSKAWGWTWWVASVLATSVLLSSLGLTPNRGDASTEPAIAPRVIYRRDQCEDNNIRSADYDVPLHVGALVIVMFVSTLACVFPVLARRFPRLHIPDAFFFAIRHFGTGVLIATAFIHLLPTAFQSLGDPCLSQFWTDDYPAMPGAIALAGVFFVIVIEMVLSPARHFSRPGVGGGMAAAEAGNRSRGSLDDTQADSPARSIEMSSQRVDAVAAAERPTPASPDADEVGSKSRVDQRGDSDIEMLTSGHILTEEQKMQKNILQCVLLEIGILFHSVFIGMALSVAVGKEFVILLIAIVFHQSFEGLALGSRIADIDWSSYPQRPWLMCLAYGLTTPIGQAIGLATHTLYSPNSAFGLILVGTMNAISSGLLVYASLVELVAVDFISDESWEVLRGKKRVVACFIVFAGALCMGLVGAWA